MFSFSELYIKFVPQFIQEIIFKRQFKKAMKEGKFLEFYFKSMGYKRHGFDSETGLMKNNIIGYSEGGLIGTYTNLQKNITMKALNRRNLIDDFIKANNIKTGTLIIVDNQVVVQ